MIFIRKLHCVGCGSLTKRAPAMAPKLAKDSVAFLDNLKTNELLPKLSQEQLEALNWQDGKQTIDKHEFEFAKQKVKLAKKAEICSECSMARGGSKTNIEISEQTVQPPPKSKRFIVIDALDFPFGVPDLELSDKNAKEFGELHKNSVFVVNRCDLIVNNVNQLNWLKDYFMKTFFNRRNINPTQVVLVSATRKWHFIDLCQKFATNPRAVNVFEGKTNSGKTTLVHALSGTNNQDLAGAATTWPVPFTTKEPLEYKSTSNLRGRIMMDMPSKRFSFEKGPFELLRTNLIRKVSANTAMMDKTKKYTTPFVNGKTGQTVSIGGLIALEFPLVEGDRLPFRVFCNINGLNHTDFLNAFKDMETVKKINSSEQYKKMRMHEQLNLELNHVCSFKPQNSENKRFSLVVEGMGFVQPFLFGDFPPNYKVNVYAPPQISVRVRPEIISH